MQRRNKRCGEPVANDIQVISEPPFSGEAAESGQSTKKNRPGPRH